MQARHAAYLRWQRSAERVGLQLQRVEVAQVCQRRRQRTVQRVVAQVQHTEIVQIAQAGGQWVRDAVELQVQRLQVAQVANRCRQRQAELLVGQVETGHGAARPAGERENLRVVVEARQPVSRQK